MLKNIRLRFKIWLIDRTINSILENRDPDNWSMQAKRICDLIMEKKGMRFDLTNTKSMPGSKDHWNGDL